MTATYSGCTTLVAKFHGPTNTLPGRIIVSRPERDAGNRHPRTYVWDHTLTTGDNYVEAITDYVTHWKWDHMDWSIGTTATGAVAVVVK